jgi:hypothetical protein
VIKWLAARAVRGAEQLGADADCFLDQACVPFDLVRRLLAVNMPAQKIMMDGVVADCVAAAQSLTQDCARPLVGRTAALEMPAVDEKHRFDTVLVQDIEHFRRGRRRWTVVERE